MTSPAERPLQSAFPQLERRLPFCRLGEFPTPVTSLADLARAACGRSNEVFAKRDDLTHPDYGGNKVRTLEVLFADALERGASRVFSTGAFGSNHALATLIHAPRVGLRAGSVLWPQPHSQAAHDNLRATLGRPGRKLWIPHWSALPFGMRAARRSEELEGGSAYVMVPGGATPLGALGYVSAALEVGHQVQRGELPRLRDVVVGVGSNCTSAGLLVGFRLAAHLGVGFRNGLGQPAPPRLTSVRVTPWPVTSKVMIVNLAVRTAQLLAELSGDPSLAFSRRALASGLALDTRFFGRGYGFPTRSGLAAMELWRQNTPFQLDTTYSAKSGAFVVDRLRRGLRGPLLYWATKSSAPLPKEHEGPTPEVPGSVKRWLAEAAGSEPDQAARSWWGGF